MKPGSDPHRHASLQKPPQRASLWKGGAVFAALILCAGTFSYLHQAPAPPPSVPLQPTAQTFAQFSMIAPQNAPQALAATNLPPDTQQNILAAVQNGRARLVSMPVLDTAGLTGQTIDITTSGLTQRITLTDQLQNVILPIAGAGTVFITPVSVPHPPGLAIGILSALGPQILPAFTAPNQTLALNVLVQ